MSNPSINFRLSKFQLARALYVIRQLEPTYRYTSLSAIVKTCFIDYIAKMNLNRSPETPSEIIIEIEDFILGKQRSINLDDVIQLNEQFEHPDKSSNPAKPTSEESTITSVSDFSPPKEWQE